MKIKAWLMLPVAAITLSMTVGHAQEDFEGEDFELEEAEAIPTAPTQAPAKTEAKKTAKKTDDDFSDADFSDEGDASFEDFDTPSEGGSGEGNLVNEGFDDSLQPAEGEFELEPLNGDEPPLEDTLPAENETAPPPPIETPADDVPPPIIAEPSEEPQDVPMPVAIETLDSGPDLGLEAELHDIYMTFHSQSIPREQWDMVVGDRQSEVYGIQSGDNLWNVSRTLFNDGNYWPKIWAINKNIENPHVIEPGDQLRFVMGSQEDPPSFTVTSGSYDDESAAAPYIPVSVIPAGSSTEIELPPPLVEPRPVLRKLPPSIPEWSSFTREGYDNVGISIERRPPLVLQSDIYLTHYVDEPDAEVLGTVVEVEGGSKTATDFQYVYVMLKAGQGQAGQKYLVAQTKDKIKPKGKFMEGGSFGSNFGEEVEIQGEIRLESAIEARSPSGGTPEKDYELFRALVEKSILNIRVGSQIRTGELQMIKMDALGPRSDVVAQITGGIYDKDRKIFGDQNVVYLSRGSQDGLEPGQVLSVRSNEVVRNSRTRIAASFRPIGIIKIVNVTSKYATAIVVKAWDEIHTGDLTGQGEILSSSESFDPAPETTESDEFEDADKATVEMIPGEGEGEDFLDPLEEESSEIE